MNALSSCPRPKSVDFIARLTLHQRLGLIQLISVLSILLIGVAGMLEDRHDLIEDRKTMTKNLVHVALTTVQAFHARQTAGELTQEQAQEGAKNVLRSMRYDHDFSNYFWINDMTPKMVMHPVKPDLVGKSVADIKDTNGQAYFMTFIDIVNKNGSGFVEYYWSKDNDPKNGQQKISYVAGFKPWGWVIGTGILMMDVEEQFQASALLLVEEMLVAMLILMALSYLIAKTITLQVGGNIHQVLATVQKLAEGDMNVRVAPPKDGQVTGMACAVNSLADRLDRIMRIVNLHSGGITACVSELMKIRDQIGDDARSSQRIVSGVSEKNNILADEVNAIVRSIGESTDSVNAIAQSAEEVSNNIITIAAGAEEASANIATMASAAEEITANIGGVNQNLSRVDQSVKNVAASIENITAALEEINRRCQSASAESETAHGNALGVREVMNRLSASAQEIGDVVDIINNIAEQTNMLALNASIEAAGAGDAGKGFAVVANEVKELARQTSDATRLISEKINRIQGNTREATEANTSVASSIDRINEANREITESVEVQSEAMVVISNSMDDVARAAGDVTRSALELGTAAQEVARAAQEAAAGTGEVAKSASAVAVAAESMAEKTRLAQALSNSIMNSTSTTIEASSVVQENMREASSVVAMTRGSSTQFSRMGEVLQDMCGALYAAQAEADLGTPMFNMRAAKAFFLGWHSRMEQAIPGRIKVLQSEWPKPEDSPAHAWLQATVNTDYGKTPRFEDLYRIHGQVFAKALETLQLIQKVAEQGPERADQKLVEYLSLIKRMFSLLDILYLENGKEAVADIPFFVWTENLNTGMKDIDDDHKKLMHMINQIHKLLKESAGKDAIGKIITELADYTHFHFGREEKLFELHRYPEIGPHKEKHVKLLNEVAELAKRFEDGDFAAPMDLLNLAKHWLINHIIRTDMRYIAYFKEKGVI
ncbi:MAG: bacteriohemerythrin [Magnetococcales bacterium]|nr:bacteriohemerythrin [Magnetococcales bacterium]